ncbi:DUF202 domain-containing protein [Streptococcus loxodontisalivarius]|uniref:DUF202 domain-containing protein n=1 Tax=Streptococcus loxodontisalivarius TaxID=1349415 RepID=A0ABS2PUM2_9STRE|nr:DUF202 domain-containing protein [Streptococcus loxodontisalivarius]MBM7643581.1 hypothetical protein [Streptococcus loxodontisalivarius]
MTEQELIAGYEEEVAYQKHMLRNLKYWYNLLFILAGLGLLLIYFYHKTNSHLFLGGCLLTALSILGMMLFSYGIYRGRQNANRLIDDLENKLQQMHS